MAKAKAKAKSKAKAKPRTKARTAKPAARVDKVIVTNQKALRAKYGAAGLATIRAAVKALIAADKGRGLRTVLVPLDDATALKKLKAKAVKVAANPKQNKEAIDGVFRSYVPDYLLILGSIDVVPHQDLNNPVYSPGADDDQLAPGDLPYACEAPYSQKPEDFTGPTRVVGRLPDLTEGKDPAYLVGLLDHAAKSAPGAFASYANDLGISAAVWQNSTQLSLQKIFGTAATLQLSPPSGPDWLPAQLQALAHFINCHGAPADSHFYGQQGNTYPIAHDAAYLAGRVQPGTVVSAECCYGAELYDPALTGGQAGIANTYLAWGAYGFFGSSTIAYGPSVGNGAADLICQFFLKHVLAGASLGRAALQARQDFVLASPVLGPIDLKTLAQFSLLGDPSIQAVLSPHAARPLPRSGAAMALMEAEGAPAPPGLGRSLRRGQLVRMGLALGAAASTIRTTDRTPTPPRVEAALRREANRVGLTDVSVTTFPVASPGPALGAMLAEAHTFAAAPAGLPGTPEEVHLAIGRIPETQAPAPQLHAILVREEDNRMVVNHLYSR